MAYTSPTPSRRPWFPITVLSVGLVVSIGLSAREDPRSAAAAKELAQVLDAGKLDGMAAADPSSPGTFLAVLYIPGTQFLVVSAKYAAPPLMADKIAKKDYREVYIDLTAASVAGTKIFIQDQQCNGLKSGDDPADSWEEGTKTISFDGDWKKQKMANEAEYQKAFTDADDRYAKMLTVLLAQAKKSGS